MGLYAGEFEGPGWVVVLEEDEHFYVDLRGKREGRKEVGIWCLGFGI